MKKTFLLLLLAVAATADAKVVLPKHFTSNMVVQQNSTLRIKGKTSPNAAVSFTASWQKNRVETKSDRNGLFLVETVTPKAGGPYTLTFNDGEETRLENVMAGEVWIGSGQSNMEMPLEGWGKVLNYQEEIAAANYPQIRLLQVKTTTSIKPWDDLVLTNDGWQVCSPQTVPNFSALCYFYALRLWEELKVPIGIIDDNWGGTPCESWVSADALTGVTGYEEQMSKIVELGQDEAKVRAYYEDVNKGFEKLETEKDPGLKQEWFRTGTPDADWPTMKVPCKWESVIGNYDGTVWFRKTTEVPEGQAGKAAKFHLSTLDDLGRCYWNGEVIGETKRILLPADFDVPASLVKAGKNELCVRLNDTGGDGGMVAKAEEMYVELADGQRITLADEWKYAKGVSMKDLPTRPLDINNSHHPSVLYNAMIAPLTDFPIKGCIWYQGCSNVGRSEQHEALFQTLITNWRQKFRNPDMPFYFVQLANYLQPRDLQPDSEWALLRESQEAALALPNTGMAVNIDLGDANDIHPKTKRELGRRLSAIALNKTYHKKMPYTAPVYDSYQVEGTKVRIHLRAEKGVEPLVQETDLKGFTIAGPDRKWHVATAHTEGNDIVVSCPDVKVPLAVRYGWADNPTCTLRTASNLHVAPFRTDRW